MKRSISKEFSHARMIINASSIWQIKNSTKHMKQQTSKDNKVRKQFFLIMFTICLSFIVDISYFVVNIVTILNMPIRYFNCLFNQKSQTNDIAAILIMSLVIVSSLLIGQQKYVINSIYISVNTIISAFKGNIITKTNNTFKSAVSLTKYTIKSIHHIIYLSVQIRGK
jgi:hypothetical protein